MLEGRTTNTAAARLPFSLQQRAPTLCIHAP